jgi:hypothetical protein
MKLILIFLLFAAVFHASLAKNEEVRDLYALFKKIGPACGEMACKEHVDCWVGGPDCTCYGKMKRCFRQM